MNTITYTVCMFTICLPIFLSNQFEMEKHRCCPVMQRCYRCFVNIDDIDVSFDVSPPLVLNPHDKRQHCFGRNATQRECNV